MSRAIAFLLTFVRRAAGAERPSPDAGRIAGVAETARR